MKFIRFLYCSFIVTMVINIHIIIIEFNIPEVEIQKVTLSGLNTPMASYIQGHSTETVYLVIPRDIYEC